MRQVPGRFQYFVQSFSRTRDYLRAGKLLLRGYISRMLADASIEAAYNCIDVDAPTQYLCAPE